MSGRVDVGGKGDCTALRAGVGGGVCQEEKNSKCAARGL